MATLRTDLRTRARDYLYETTADWFSDAQLNRLASEEVNSLGRQDLYNEEQWTTNLVANQRDYTLPTGTIKVEGIEEDFGTGTNPNWQEFKGYDVYNGAIWLNFNPYNTNTIKVKIRKTYTAPTDDTTALDIPDDITEVVVWGMVVRGYRMVIGYLRGSKSWDSVTKPGDVSIPQIQNWLRDADQHYKELLKQYQTVPRPRDIDLVS